MGAEEKVAARTRKESKINFGKMSNFIRYYVEILTLTRIYFALFRKDFILLDVYSELRA